MKNRNLESFFLLLFTFAFCLSGHAQNLTVREIMAEPSIAGQRVEGEKLSPDGSKVVYLWNAEGKQPRDLYLVSTSGGASQIILRQSDLPRPSATPQPESKLDYGVEVRDEFVKVRENALGGFEWSPDSKKLVFAFGGDVYVITVADKAIKRFTRTQSPESGARFLDNDRILFSQSGHWFVLNTADATLVQLTREANPQTFVSVGGVVPNKQGSMIAYVVSDNSKQRPLIVPNFVPEYVTGGGPRRGWTEQKLFVTPADGSRDAPFEIKLPKHEGVSFFRRMVWTADGRSLIVDRNDKDTKRRQLFYIHNVASKDEQTILITEETDDKWQAPLSTIFEPHPRDASQLFFCSERDGFSHIYLATLEKRTPKPNPTGVIRQENPTDPGYTGKVDIIQLTRGNWQVEWARWTADGWQIIFLSTQDSTADRNFYAVPPSTGERVILPFFNEGPILKLSGQGMLSNPQMDDQNAQPILLFSRSRWNQPDDLFAQKVCSPRCTAPAPPRLITNTVPANFTSIKWTEPKFIDIPSRDGKVIKSKIYLPAGHDPKKKYPMAIFVHGAGYLQNSINGWNNYWREFMFNDLLAKRGYVVLDIDYRGSAGYGRDWRTDVYDFLGGKDFDDHIDAIDHMVKNYGVDQKRIGVYGGSYGGFMAGMLAMRAPERIAAAAALRPVFDWKNYYAANPQYTAQRLGFPDRNPEAYKRSSPISYADKLERPLLILHGMSDDNVHVQDSVQLMEKLVRLGKTRYFEAMLYPSENHGFVRPESWTDEYERILALFEKHLK
ncbi:MAG: alpha/beta fold hydrolase [Pyrinomonadaceae bacterium]